MMKEITDKIIKKIEICAFILTISIFGNLFSQTVPAGFEIKKVLDLCCNDLGFDILPDGRIIIINKFGKVKFYVNAKLRREFLSSTLLGNTFYKTESGLTGIAIDPDYPVAPYLYLFYSHIDSTNRISRFTFKGDLTDVNSNNLLIEDEFVLLKIPFENDIHNGGTLRFGKDKTLYISYGDDRNSRYVQDLTKLNGKILRINRDGTIPDNPIFPNERIPNGLRRKEIFAFGLRNPFRFSLNINDEIFIGDVGENSKEELNISKGGENFGWPRYEGTKSNDSLAKLIDPRPLFPIFEYDHIHPGDNAVIALLSYNRFDSNGFPEEFDNTYFYADFFGDWIDYLKFDGYDWISKRFGTGFVLPVDAMLAQDGSIYILEFGRALSKITYTKLPIWIDVEVIKEFRNFPNPFNGTTTITYSLISSSFITLKIFNLLGGEVSILVDEFKPAGEYQTIFDASKLPTGIYFYVLKTESKVFRNKMLYIK